MNKWLKIIITITIFAVLSVISFFTLKSLGLTDVETIKNLISESKGHSLFIFSLINVVISVLLCFIPLLPEAISAIGIILFDPITTFILVIVSDIISSSILFYIGDKFGEGLARKIVGKESFENAQNLISNKSKTFLPFLYLIPVLPHEAITLVAGMTKLKYWYILLINVLHTAIEAGIVCFLGSGLIIWSALSILDWIILINVLIIDIILLLKLKQRLKK